MSRGREALLQLLLAAAVLTSGQAPAPRGAAPADVFSAERAAQHLHAVWQGIGPHPTGSAANQLVRERLQDRLTLLGFAHAPPDAPGSTWHVASGSVAGRPINNLVARIDGAPGPALVLSCHYDSAPEGPGVSDDGVGVAAVLEVARALLAEAPLSRPVVLLINDGEEAGLLGARLFLDAHPWSTDLDGVINLEARGTGGPSLMFETSGPDAHLVDLFARYHPRPVSSSAFTEVYRRMPNATDLTIVRQHGVPGLNFAFIHGASRYHTALDDLDHVDLGSLQHHGDGALALARAALAEGFTHDTTDDAVYFDVAALGIVRWPARFTLPLAALTWLALTATALRQRPWRALLSLPAAWLGAAALGLPFVSWVAEPFPDTVLPTLTLACGLALASLFAASRLAGPHTAQARWTAGWWWHATLGLLLAATLPGLSYLFVAPAALAAICGLLDRDPLGARWRSLLPALLAAVVWVRLLHLLPVALGAHLVPLYALCAAIYLGVVRDSLTAAAPPPGPS